MRRPLRVSARAPWLAVVVLWAAGCGPATHSHTPGAAPGPARPAPVPGDTDAADAEADARRIAAIERAINETGEVRHQCWALGAADDFRLAGAIVLELAFSAAGGAANVSVVSDEPADPRLTRCLVELYGAYRWPPVFEPGQVVTLPFRFESPRLQFVVDAAHVAPATLADGKLEVAVILDQRNTGNGAGALSLLTIRDGMEVAPHRHTSAELLYVRAGTGLVYGARGKKRGTPVTAGDAIYIPAGAPHGFVQVGAEPIALVQLYAPGGPEQRFKGGPAVGTTPVPERELNNPKQPQPVVVSPPIPPGKRSAARARGKTATAYPIAGGKGQVTIYLDPATTRDQQAYMGILTAQTGTAVPEHTHPGSTEILLITAGEGRTLIDGTWYPARPGVAIQIPAGITHAFEVTGAPIEAIQFYTPAGPEQRFKGAAQ